MMFYFGKNLSYNSSNLENLCIIEEFGEKDNYKLL